MIAKTSLFSKLLVLLFYVSVSYASPRILLDCVLEDHPKSCAGNNFFIVFMAIMGTVTIVSLCTMCFSKGRHSWLRAIELWLSWLFLMELISDLIYYLANDFSYKHLETNALIWLCVLPFVYFLWGFWMFSQEYISRGNYNLITIGIRSILFMWYAETKVFATGTEFCARFLTGRGLAPHDKNAPQYPRREAAYLGGDPYTGYKPFSLLAPILLLQNFFQSIPQLIIFALVLNCVTLCTGVLYYWYMAYRQHDPYREKGYGYGVGQPYGVGENYGQPMPGQAGQMMYNPQYGANPYQYGAGQPGAVQVNMAYPPQPGYAQKV
eukprot:TRINITY_DN7707_c0_g1_i1.p1 TRINITY_DN7707_c0_g1~~TRINITY_DN7707_c0_g1_i1.p1  ORF type:complete len:322 (+),score=53.65 TRINITY_DN7707_c0_g1_i1:457-1422(+)